MPTVSDVLAIKLQLDTTGLTTGEQKALQEIGRVKVTLQQQGEQLERLVKNIGENVFTALKGVAGLMGVVLSFQGFKSMTQQVVEAGTSMGRFSEAVEISATRVGELEQAFQRAGGRSEEIRPLLSKMKSDIMAVRVGGPIPDWMKTLGQPPFSMGGLQYRSPDDILLELSRKAQGMSPTQLGQYLPGLGVSPENLAILTKPGLLQQQLGAVQAGGTAPTTAQVEAAERLKEKFANLEQLSDAVLRDLVTITEPLLTSVLDFITKTLDWLHGIERRLIGSPSSSSPSVSGGSARAPTYTRPPMVGSRPDFGGFRPQGGTGTRYGSQEREFSGGSIDTGTVPSDVLGKAKVVALQGGPGAVEQFMASQGYPKSGNWCGEFAAAVIKSVGGKPPTGAAVASNWRRWGEATNAPMPGDIAVRKGPPTGETGSHVTFVESYDPQTGTFVGLGGNQSRWRSRYSASSFEFRHGENVGAGGVAPGPGAGVRGSTFDSAKTASGRSAASTPGIAIPSGGKMGDMYEITTPDGRKFVAPLIDRGPADWTGRGVDISGPLAEQMGYGRRNFPTDSRFVVRPLSSPQSLLRAPNVGVGAAAAASAPQPENRVISNENSAVVNHVTVHTNATDAASIAKDVRQEIGRQLSSPSLQANDQE